MAGRKTIYTEELGESIASLIMEGRSVNRICQSEQFPASTTVHRWICDFDHPFREKYARAVEARGIYFGEKVSEIAQLVLSGRVDPNAGRVAIDALKWSAGRMNPRRYGDRIDVNANHSGRVDHGVVVFAVGKLSEDEFDALAAGSDSAENARRLTDGSGLSDDVIDVEAVEVVRRGAGDGAS